MSEAKKRRLSRSLLIILAGLFITLVGLGVWSFVIEPQRLVINQETLALARWPVEFNNLRVAVVSDLHVGSPHITEQKLDEVVNRINEQQPDAIFLLGDFMVGNVSRFGGKKIEAETIAAHLEKLHAPLGVYAVLGNHDWWYNGPRVIAALKNANITVLENEAAPLAQKNGQSVWLAGLADLWTRPQAIETTLRHIPPDAYVIALTHNPDVFPDVPPSVGLTLAGHTHGGQVKLPLLGTLVVPSNYGQRYARGRITENQHDLFVTSGVGSSIMPIRFRVPPEIGVLTLQAK